MTKHLFFAVLAGCAMTTLAVADWGWRRVTVESRDGHRNYRSIPNNGVKLRRKLSSSPCDEGRSWGYDDRGIWVDRGCRAEFEVQTEGRPGGPGRPGRPGWPGRPGGDDLGWTWRRMRLESKDNRRHVRLIPNDGVRLVKKFSDAPCDRGRSWGYDDRGLWVDRGCRAEFDVRVRGRDRH